MRRDALWISSLVFLPLLIAPVFARAAPACTGTILPGCRCATDTDIAAGLPAGMPVCAADIRATKADKAGPAKQYLASILRGGSCGPYRTTFEQLDPEFAICAARFLEDARKREPRLHIVSAFRSKDHQAYLCGGGCGRVNGPCAAAGSSKHQYGIALDLSTGSYILPGWIQQMARGYGLHFPVRGDSGHMEPVKGSECADPNFRPTDTSTQLPFTDNLRKIFQPQPQQTAPQSSQQALPQSQQSSLQGAFQPAGTAGIGLVSVASTSTTAQSSQTNTRATSTTEILSSIAYGTTTSASTTVTFVPFTIGTTDVSVLRPDSPSTNSLPGSSPYTPLPSSQNTFTSPDLSGRAPQQYAPGSTPSTLESIRIRLIALLGYLQPFALRSSGEHVSE